MNNKSSFSQLLLGMQDNLLSFAYKLTANSDDAHDLLQDTTLKALDNQDYYVTNVNFKGWLFTIMRNIFINNYRRSMREKTLIDTSEDLYQLNVAHDESVLTPEGSFALSDIDNALSACSEEFAYPFSLYLSGYKYEEIAEKMQLPLGTVKSRIFTARQRLKKILKDYR